MMAIDFFAKFSMEGRSLQEQKSITTLYRESCGNSKLMSIWKNHKKYKNLTWSNISVFFMEDGLKKFISKIDYFTIRERHDLRNLKTVAGFFLQTRRIDKMSKKWSFASSNSVNSLNKNYRRFREMIDCYEVSSKKKNESLFITF